MLRNRSLQLKLLLLAFFAETILSKDDDLKRLCVEPKYNVERRTELVLAYEFCKRAFPQLFKTDANTAHQTLLAPAKVPTSTQDNKTEVFEECPALLLLAPEWTVGLLRRQGQARQRLMGKWRQLMTERPLKLNELIFFACMSTFANEHDVIYIDWPEKMKEKNKCPELSTEASKFEDLQSLAGNINIMTTKSEAEQSRKEAAYAFCRALHAEFSEEWTSEKASSLQTEDWSLGVDVWLVPGCPYAALLQPEVRMMRERREIDPKLRKQLGKYLFWPQVMGEKEDDALKSATLELCKFAFLPEKEGGMPTWTIVVICISCALLLLILIIFAARCTWSYYQKKKKTKEEAELAWTNGMMGEQDQLQSTKTTQKNSPTSMFEEDSTCEDSAKTLDMQPSEENFQPLKDDKNTEEGSMMKTAMMPLPLDKLTDQTFDTAMTRETDQSGR